MDRRIREAIRLLRKLLFSPLPHSEATDDGDGNRRSIFAGNAGIIITPFRSAIGRLSESRAKIQVYGYTITALHELIHHSAHMAFSDQQLAQAAVDVGGLSPEELEQWNNLNKNDAIETSRFWQNLLQKHCPMKE